MKPWLLAWSLIDQDSVKHYDVTTYEDGMERLTALHAPRYAGSIGHRRAVYPALAWASVMHNTPANRKALGL